MLAAGSRVGPYEIVACAGAGGMGEVWKARDPRLNRTVAIKISDKRFTDRFGCGGRAIAALNHAVYTVPFPGPGGKVAPLFRLALTGGQLYDVSADGKRILAIAPHRSQKDEMLSVVQNWTAALKK